MLALALKGSWALVLANKAKEEQAMKRNDLSKLTSGPRNQIKSDGGPVNADGKALQLYIFYLGLYYVFTNSLKLSGTSRTPVQIHLDARRLLRIDKMCHFLLLENESIAGYLVLSIVQV